MKTLGRTFGTVLLVIAFVISGSRLHLAGLDRLR